VGAALDNRERRAHYSRNEYLFGKEIKLGFSMEKHKARSIAGTW
jgi:hypothetical protein